MSTSTIDVNIDKLSLVNAIASDICAQCGAGGGINPLLLRPIAGIGGSADTVTFVFDQGWYKLKFTGGYPKIEPSPPWIPFNLLGDSQSIMFMATFYLASAPFDSYVLFNEPAPTFATDVLGFHLYSDGTFAVDPGAGSATGTTSMTVAQGDIILAVWHLGKVSGTLYMRFGAGKYDWATDTYTQVIDAYMTVPSTYTRNFRYIVLWEPNASQGTIGITAHSIKFEVMSSAPTNGVSVLQAVWILRILRNHGLPDPSTLNWNI